MKSLDESRTAFLEEVEQYSGTSSKETCRVTLADLVNWSTRYLRLEHSSNDYEQGVVSFTDKVTDRILWSAYPRKRDGAKLEVLPGGRDHLPDLDQAAGAALARSLSREPLAKASLCRIPFRALEDPIARERVMDLMAHVMISSDIASQDKGAVE